jgi:hypothetical protein
VLNDLFGIQARGGCSCAGPYGHRLLAIDGEHSHAFEDEIERGCDGIKPGWVRVNFNYFISDTVRDYLIDAVDLIAERGHLLLADYTFDPHTGLWRHRAQTARSVRVPDLRRVPYEPVAGYDGTRLGEDALADHLDQARRLLAGRTDKDEGGSTGRTGTYEGGPTGLPPDFEALRWFVLPPACLTG